MAYLDNNNITPIAYGLSYPEGPIYCKDGSILLVEIHSQQLTRVLPDGTAQKLASIPGGPNGAAIGPDISGKPQVYICNDGGFDWISIPPPECNPPPADYSPWLWITGNQPKDYSGGKLQRVDIQSGEVHDLFSHTSQPPGYPPPPALPKEWVPPFPLAGPDDLVFDHEGGLWFTDFGKQRITNKDVTGVYYMSPDGSTMRQAIYPLNSTNGIGISPDGKWLYVALSFERRVLKYEIGENGTFIPNKRTLDGSYLVTGDFPGSSVLDSMAIDTEGNLYVATMIPQGADPMINGGITVVTPDGKHTQFLEINLDGLPHAPPACPLPSNICFGGDDMKTAYITCGGTSHLISMPSDIPGLPLKYNI